MPVVRQSEFPKDNLGPDVLRRFYIKGNEYISVK